MTITPARRRRRQPDALRDEAIAAARAMLIADGPAAITLQRVAAALGMTHGSITHHFGSAANLQAAVADALAAELLADVRAGACALKAGSIDEAALVDLVFDAFERTGAGRLIGWLAAHDSPLLEPLFDRFARLPQALAADREPGAAFTQHELPAIIEGVVIPALASAQIGGALVAALGLPARYIRERVARALARERAARLPDRG